jgi:large subunit ribosomal protein L6
MRSLVANMIHGVHKGFDCTLNIVGVGYKADVRGKSINFNLGHSHAISFPLPEGITASFDKPSNSLTIKGNKKQLVGEVAAEIRQLRPPEPYKGKGVMYKGEKILRKVGKTGTK